MVYELTIRSESVNQPFCLNCPGFWLLLLITRTACTSVWKLGEKVLEKKTQWPNPRRNCPRRNCRRRKNILPAGGGEKKRNSVRHKSQVILLHFGQHANKTIIERRGDIYCQGQIYGGNAHLFYVKKVLLYFMNVIRKSISNQLCSFAISVNRKQQKL